MDKDQGKGRTYRSARRRDQEAGQLPRDPWVAERQQRIERAQRMTRENRQQPAQEVVMAKRPSSSLYGGPRKKRGWARWKGLVLGIGIPVLSIALILLGIHGVYALTAERPDPAIAEQERYERVNFPLYYRDLIQQNAVRYDLPQSLIAAMILSESSFKADAESRVNARGLMQVMPDTAQWIGEKLDEGEGYSFDMMYNPEDNMRYACWYLGYLYDRFDGDTAKIVSAYHSGQNSVDAWLQNPEYSKDGVTLDVIPIESTAAYAKRVLSAQEVYRRRYFAIYEPT